MYFHVTAAGAAPLVAACTQRAERGGGPVRAQGRGPPGGIHALRRRGAVPGAGRLRRCAPIARERGGGMCAHLRPRPAGVHEAAGLGRRRRRASPGARRELRDQPLPARRRGRRPSARAGRRRARRAPRDGGAPVRRPRPRRRPARTWQRAPPRAMRSDGEAFLGVAADIAHRIAGSAVWSDGRCNWMGVPASERSRVSGRAAVAALGPDLYEGTSGVALFLAEAAARLDEPRLRATALGAIAAGARAGRTARDATGSTRARSGSPTRRGASPACSRPRRSRRARRSWWPRGAATNGRPRSTDVMSGCAGGARRARRTRGARRARPPGSGTS